MNLFSPIRSYCENVVILTFLICERILMLPFIQTSLAELVDGTIYFLELSKKKFRFFSRVFALARAHLLAKGFLLRNGQKTDLDNLEEKAKAYYCCCTW